MRFTLFVSVFSELGLLGLIITPTATNRQGQPSSPLGIDGAQGYWPWGGICRLRGYN